MEKMRAVVFEKHGDFNQLQYTYVQRPEPGPGEVLIKVHACALNRLDLWTLRCMPSVKIPLPHIPGCDISGEIAATGAKVKGLAKKKRVVVCPGIVSNRRDPFAREGWDSLSENYKIIGFLTDGGYAEYVTVPAENVIPV